MSAERLQSDYAILWRAAKKAEDELRDGSRPSIGDTFKRRRDRACAELRRALDSVLEPDDDDVEARR